jgi:lysyl-tRNA synthetase class 2
VTEKERLAPRIANLRARARALSALRRFFDQRGFLEVEAPLLVPSPGLELHLDAFRVDGAGFLITSPEYQLKRLCAGGLDKIFAVAKCFRRGEAGGEHNPEFTMVEWYRAPGSWRAVADDVEALCAELAIALVGAPRIERGGRTIELAPPWRALSVREAMERFARVRLDGDEPAAVLAERGRAAGWPVSAQLEAWDDVFFAIFLAAVEPELAAGPPTTLYDWPAPLAALARLAPSDPRVAERFECYAGGLELANGFGELVDPEAQRARCEREQVERRARGLPVYPLDEKFLAALGAMPPSGGVALGFDRVAMLLTGAAAIRDVLPFSVDEL